MSPEKSNRKAASPVNKVMLVEDDSNMQAVLSTLLEIEGFEVVIAPDRKGHQELVAYIRNKAPDIMIMDVRIGNVSGIDLLSELRQDEVFRNTKVVMTSGLDVRERCMAAGASSFLQKPFMPEELIQKLRD